MKTKIRLLTLSTITVLGVLTTFFRPNVVAAAPTMSCPNTACGPRGTSICYFYAGSMCYLLASGCNGNAWCHIY